MNIDLDEIELFFEDFLAPTQVDKLYNLTDRIRDLEELVGDLQLYTFRKLTTEEQEYVFEQLSPEQKQLFTECVEAWRSALHADEWEGEQP